MNVQTILIVAVLSCVYGQDRKISAKFNPGCHECDRGDTLLYITAEGSKDTIHQIWDFTRGMPTIIYAISDVNSSMSITWVHNTPTVFTFSSEPKYSFGAVIDELYEYDDVKDDGHYDSQSERRSFPLAHLTWWRKDSVVTDKEVMLRLRGLFREKRGAIDMKLDLLPFKDYAVDLPHLIHTANSTLVEISLTNLTSTYNSSRFALHFLLASTDKPNDSMHYAMRKSLDDEHTPGVFEIIEIKTPKCYEHEDGGFIQFRPVAYTQPERSVTTSTIVHMSDFNRTSLSWSTMRFFYTTAWDQPILVEDLVVSFGEAGDGFYKQHNYTSWSFTLGYGTPPLESFSLFVILIISIGLGVPVVLALSGVVYVVSRRCRQRNSPARLRDEE